MPTTTTNLLNNTLQICVYEYIQVVDIFDNIVRRIKEVVTKIYGVAIALIRKIIVNKIIFANLNNHSSPPNINIVEATDRFFTMRLCMNFNRAQSFI